MLGCILSLLRTVCLCFVNTALFTTTSESRRPNLSCAAANAAATSSGLLTSSFTVKRRSEGYLEVRSASAEGLLAVATTMSPFSSATSVRMRPKPLDAPVTVDCVSVRFSLWRRARVAHSLNQT